MSGFGAFESEFDETNIRDEDPAADFLAREQNELAGLADDNFMMNGGDTVSSGDFIDYNGINGQDEVIGDEMNGYDDLPSIHPPRPTEEPEKIRLWREEQRVRLEQKDAEENVKKDELRETAKKELDDWYKHYAEQIQKTKTQNRAAEQEYVKDRDAETPGQEWERIAKLCDFNPKSSKHSKDVSRMRSILLQLKQTPLAKKAR